MRNILIYFLSVLDDKKDDLVIKNFKNIFYVKRFFFIKYIKGRG